MTRLEALTELAAKVEAGANAYWPGTDFHIAMGGKSYESIGKTKGALECDRAYHGSLDAAKALHEAVLMAWDVDIEMRPLGPTIDSGLTDVSVYWPYRDEHFRACHDDPARAWLLAILHALIAKEKAA